MRVANHNGNTELVAIRKSKYICSFLRSHPNGGFQHKTINRLYIIVAHKVGDSFVKQNAKNEHCGISKSAVPVNLMLNY